MVHHLLRKRGDSGTSSWTSRRSTKKKIAAANSSGLLLLQQHDDIDSSSNSNYSRIASLAKKGKFDLLFQELNEMPRDRFLQSTTTGRGEPSSSILHIVLAYRPPLYVVEWILNRMKADDCCPVPEEIKDTLTGQTPLHVAVAAGCDIAIIDRLLSGVSLLVPALTKDLLERYPLHWACCLEPKKSRTRSSSYHSRAAERDNNRRETVYLLVNTYPVAVVIADVYGKTPLDYAMENKHFLDARIIDALQTVAQHHQKYKALVGRQLGAVSSANRTAAPPTSPRAVAKQPNSTLLKRKKPLLLRGKKYASVVAGAQPTSETERDSTDNEDPTGNRSSSNDDEDDDEDKVSLPAGLLLAKNSSRTLSDERRNTLRVDSNNMNMMDDLSTLGWDVLSATAPSSPTTKKRSSSPTKKKRSSPISAAGRVGSVAPIVARVKTLAVSPPAAPSSAHHQPVAAVAALTTSSVIITSHVRCRCKSLLRGRLNHDNKPISSSKGGRRRRRVSIKSTTTTAKSPPKEDNSLTPSFVEEPAAPAAAPTGADEEPTKRRAKQLDQDQVKQQDDDVVQRQHQRTTTAIHAYRRFVRV